MFYQFYVIHISEGWYLTYVETCVNMIEFIDDQVVLAKIKMMWYIRPLLEKLRNKEN